MKQIWVVAGVIGIVAGCSGQQPVAPVSTSLLGAGPAPESASQSAHGAAVADGLGYHGPLRSDKPVGD